MKKQICLAAILAALSAPSAANVTIGDYCVQFARTVEAGAQARDSGATFERLRSHLYKFSGPAFIRIEMEAFLELMFTEPNFIVATPAKLRETALRGCLALHGSRKP